MKRGFIVFSALAAMCAAPVFAQDFPRTLPTRDGAVIITDATAQAAYDAYQFAPSRRAGDVLYVSGVILGRGPNEGNDAEAFRAQTRRAFARLDQHLRAAGLTFDDVVMINSFHVWESPHFAGQPIDQLQLINEVKAEYISGPQPAWTAVGTTGLLADTGIVEIQLIAHYPSATQER